MSIINVQNLTFGYDGSFENVFENVTLRLDTDWKLGFTGRNGRGKTTFLNLLMGRHEYKGSISANVNFEYFPYEYTRRGEEQSTLDILHEINSGFELWELERELSKLEADTGILYRPFDSLSNGERVKSMLAVMFLKDDNFLLIDEPTNHLDANGRRLAAKYLASKKGFIIVSHDRAFLDECTDHTLSINKTDIEIQRGNFSSWFHNKQLQDNFELEKNAKLKKEIKRLEETSREKAAWSDSAERGKIGFDPRKVEKNMGRRAYEGAKSKKLMKLSKSIEKRQSAAIEEKSALLRNIEESEGLKIKPLPFHSKRLAELNGVSLFYGEREIFSNISLTVNQGDRIALTGKNGCGKSSLIKLILGDDIKLKGDFFRAHRLKISYVPQDASDLSGSLADYERLWNIDTVLFRAILRKLDFSRAQFEKDLSSFSEGQKKKTLIARSLCEEANLYVWDEPLNYIDVMSRMQIEELIMEYQPTLLFVEHDKMFSDKVATKFVRFSD